MHLYEEMIETLSEMEAPYIGRPFAEMPAGVKRRWTALYNASEKLLPEYLAAEDEGGQ